MTPLAFHGVSKSFGGRAVISGLEFAVAAGEVFGFLGGNGAGKTTSLRMALDIIRPDAGEIEVLGGRPGRRNSPMLGFLPEERGLYRNMTAIDTVVYFGRLKGMDAPSAHRSGTEILERFGLAASIRLPVQNLSKGMAQKVQLATAVINSPRLLILDEPFSGLDPVNQTLLEAEIQRLAATGCTVVFSTHIMQHAERLCDRLMFLAKGRKAFEGTTEQARGRLPSRLRLVARECPERWPGVAQADRLSGSAAEGWQEWMVALGTDREPDDLLEFCTTQGIALRSFDVLRPTLHDVFIHIAGDGENQW